MANDKKIAFLVASEGIEAAELVQPWDALTDAGHRLLDNAGPAIDQALESLKTVRAQRGEVR